MPSNQDRTIWVAEVTLVIAIVMSVVGLLTVQTPRGKWAMVGALVLGLLSGLKIAWGERIRQSESTCPHCSRSASEQHPPGGRERDRE